MTQGEKQDYEATAVCVVQTAYWMDQHKDWSGEKKKGLHEMSSKDYHVYVAAHTHNLQKRDKQFQLVDDLSFHS